MNSSNKSTPNSMKSQTVVEPIEKPLFNKEGNRYGKSYTFRDDTYIYTIKVTSEKITITTTEISVSGDEILVLTEKTEKKIAVHIESIVNKTHPDDLIALIAKTSLSEISSDAFLDECVSILRCGGIWGFSPSIKKLEKTYGSSPTPEERETFRVFMRKLALRYKQAPELPQKVIDKILSLGLEVPTHVGIGTNLDKKIQKKNLPTDHLKSSKKNTNTTLVKVREYIHPSVIGCTYTPKTKHADEIPEVKHAYEMPEVKHADEIPEVKSDKFMVYERSHDRLMNYATVIPSNFTQVLETDPSPPPLPLPPRPDAIVSGDLVMTSANFIPTEEHIDDVESEQAQQVSEQEPESKYKSEPILPQLLSQDDSI